MTRPACSAKGTALRTPFTTVFTRFLTSANTKLHGEDDQGRILDFHSLRVTFITRLSAAGVHPRTAQALARHSNLELTMKTYTDVRLLDLRGAVEALADASEASPRRRQA